MRNCQKAGWAIRYPRSLVTLLQIIVLTGCTSTAVDIGPTTVASPANPTSSIKLAVLQSTASPGHPETAEQARKALAMIASHKWKVLAPSQVDSAFDQRPFVPGELEIDALQRLADTLQADYVIWATVDQYTPYSWNNRLVPATPPYVEITLSVFGSGTNEIRRTSANKQGSLPATIWSRQPTFEDVAKPVLEALLTESL